MSRNQLIVIGKTGFANNIKCSNSKVFSLINNETAKQIVLKPLFFTSKRYQKYVLSLVPACDEGPGVFAKCMALGSLLLVIASLPVSLFFVVKVVQVSIHRTLDYIAPLIFSYHLICATSKAAQNAFDCAAVNMLTLFTIQNSAEQDIHV